MINFDDSFKRNQRISHDGYTEFLHIAIPADAPTRSLSECGLRDGPLSVAGILHRRSAARIRAAEILCQLSFA